MYAETLDYKYVIDGNETKFKLVPVKVRIQYLNTDVDYQQYLVFEKGTQNLQENIIFTWHNIKKYNKFTHNFYNSPQMYLL